MSVLPSISPAMIRLYDAYTHTPLARRDFLARLARLTGGVAAAYAVLPLLENNYAMAETVAADDVRLQAEQVVFATLRGMPLQGYRVRPVAAADPLPGVIVIHENRGLNPHIRDVARRLALAGFRVLAPDYLSLAGGTPDSEDAARALFGLLDSVAVRDVSVLARQFLAAEGSGRVGVVGFCWGGGQALQLAVHDPRLQAAVSYYGSQPASVEVAGIRAALLLHYAGLDERINAGVPAFEQALQQAGKVFELYRYPGVNHAFNNDTNAARYDRAAAELAWQRTLTFLFRHLV